jgi:DNA polymerase-3 subunit alpha
MTLDKALAAEPRIKERMKDDPGEKLMDIARSLEGLPRHASTHAAGVVIGDVPLPDIVPLYKGSKDETVTQFDMKCVEKAGLIKFDFLGLRTLTVMDMAVKMVRRNHDPKFSLGDIDLADEDSISFCRGDTTGVFQLESSGMKELLTRMKPEAFEDIIALVALYRPGPLESGMVTDYVDCKHGRKKVVYPLPQLEKVLKETYGVIVYQEQVQEIARVLAGYSLGEGDILRRAMGKKVKEVMDEQRRYASWTAPRKTASIPKRPPYLRPHGQVRGLRLQQIPQRGLRPHRLADRLYEGPLSPGVHGRGFDQRGEQHRQGDGPYRRVPRARSYRAAAGYQPVGQDVHGAQRSGAIRFGLAAVKNVGEGAVDSILEAREEEGPFEDIYDLCERVDLRR